MAKEAAEITKRRFKLLGEEAKEQERRAFVQAVVRSNVNASYEDNDYGMMDDTPEYEVTPRNAWEKYTIKELVDLYVASLAKGKPSLALTNPQQKAHICTCTDKRTKSVTLYMMCAHVERSLVYCKCTPLVKVLFQMQFLASGGKTPNAAIHFAMLNYLHVTKMIEQTATHGFTEIANTINDEGKALRKDVLNNVYLLYRRIVNHSTDLTTKSFSLSQSNCYSCDGAKNKYVTMDAEKQGRDVFVPLLDSVFSPSAGEIALWGNNAEVEHFDTKVDSRKECLLESLFDDDEEELDSRFKANTSNSRSNNNKDRFVENGAFVMCCTDHGIPERMYDIYGGKLSEKNIFLFNEESFQIIN